MDTVTDVRRFEAFMEMEVGEDGLRIGLSWVLCVGLDDRRLRLYRYCYDDGNAWKIYPGGCYGRGGYMISQLVTGHMNELPKSKRIHTRMASRRM